MVENTGLVLEGGGFRGIYTAAVLDVFLKENIRFRYLMGVSAGAAYGVSYVSGQYERNLRVNNYVSDRRYCSISNFITTGNYFNWEFVFKEIPTKLVPFDYAGFSASGTRMRVAITNCVTGKAEYFDLDGASPDRFRDLLAATSSLPLVSRMQTFDGKLYMDGGIADAIPVNQALLEGNNRVVVILTRPPGYRKKPSSAGRFLKYFYPRYPEMVQTFKERADRYNRTLNLLEALENEGRAFIIRPSQAIGVSRLENKPDKLKTAYFEARMEAGKILPGLKEWLG